MPAGDMLTANYEHEIDAYLIGDDDPWCVDNVTGWVGSSVTAHDVDLDLADGSVAATDVRSARVITLELYCTLADDDEVFEAIDDLQQAWAIGTDVELHAMLPHFGHVYVVGRCRDLAVADLRDAPHGRVEVQATFVANDPTIHVVEP